MMRARNRLNQIGDVAALEQIVAARRQQNGAGAFPFHGANDLVLLQHLRQRVAGCIQGENGVILHQVINDVLKEQRILKPAVALGHDPRPGPTACDSVAILTLAAGTGTGIQTCDQKPTLQAPLQLRDARGIWLKFRRDPAPG
jgi:hypothetical protein